MHKQPDLLDQLSQAAREQTQDEQDRLDPRWDRLAAGLLSAEEHDELLGLADASGEANEAYRAFKPLGPAFESRVAAAILARQQVEAEERLAAEEEAVPAAAVSPPAPAVSPPGRRAWYFGGLGSVLAAAMTVMFFVSSLADPLPNYAPERLAGISEDRGSVPALVAGGGTPVYFRGNEIPLVAEARIEPGEKPEAQLFYVAEDGRLSGSKLAPRIDNGGMRVAFSPIVGDDLELPPGNWRLVVVIARPGKWPDSTTLLEAVKSGGQTAKYWQVLVYPVKVESLGAP